MHKKGKVGIIALLPMLMISLVFSMFIIFSIDFELTTIILIFLVTIPYSLAFFIEYSEKNDPKGGKLTESELNLIQEHKNIIKSLEIIIISFSFLFGLFTSIQFDLQLVGNASYKLMNLLASLFGVNFFMGTFVFIQTQVLGKDAFLKKSEIDSTTIETQKTSKMIRLIKKMRFANFVRKGCYFSLLIQISLVYPFVMGNVII